MKKEHKNSLCGAILAFLAFILWTTVVSFVNVEEVGPQNSTVGLARINQFIHDLTGVNMCLYTVTDWLGIIPFCFIIAFALLGSLQWIKRKNLLKVDYSILVLGGFYITVMVFYILFEITVVNYRPVLINGCLEASYPSSTTMLAACVMPTAMMELNSHIKNTVMKHFISCIIITFTGFMIIGRLVSGVHWFTDIVGGILLSVALIKLYQWFINMKKE